MTDYSFAIKCGGNRTIASSDGTVYEVDSAALTSASYFMTGTSKWAVSTVGSFAEASNPDYILNTASQFSNTLDSELYQTSRISPSSLRYYGLGLENGNYTVKLHFAETQILDPPSWKTNGRRIFDIYIQVRIECVFSGIYAIFAMEAKSYAVALIKHSMMNHAFIYFFFTLNIY